MKYVKFGKTTFFTTVSKMLLQIVVEVCSLSSFTVGTHFLFWKIYAKSDRLQIPTGCRFVHVADSYTWSFKAYAAPRISISKKLTTQVFKEATTSCIFSLWSHGIYRSLSLRTSSFPITIASAFPIWHFHFLL